VVDRALAEGLFDRASAVGSWDARTPIVWAAKPGSQAQWPSRWS